ncbi:MAG: hypothetical protein IJC24_06135, partial [Clostridia bacterium]|nr:hypothetical protein [Clostridia bacterium]
ELMNNDNCLLDTCDVVSVDAIGTGYARLYNQEARAKYCSTSVDAEMFAMCIRKWLTAHKRWNSPVYIMGESYGTIRTAMVADALFYSPNIDGAGLSMQVSGIINIGSALNYGQTPFPIPATVLSLPSIAAAHWYHHPEGKGSLKEFFDECMAFCYDEYVPALAKGSSLPLEQQKAVAEKLHRYTGYSVEKLLDDKLNVDVMKYPILGMSEEGASIGLYDARFRLGRFKDVEGFDYFSDDASNALSMPAFAIAFNALWKDQLNIDIDDEYIEFWNGAEQSWNYQTKVSPIRLLEKAMHRNPKMKVMFGMGYYDMLTTTGWVHYLVNHYDLPKDRLYLNYYEAGHMPYIGDRQAGELLNDIKAFIKDC